jgi:hypothetical protein
MLDRKKRRPMRGGDIYDLKDRSIALLRLPRSSENEEKRSRSRAASRQSTPIFANGMLP